MAAQLWLLRHGEAEPHDARADDADRRLTERGEAQARDAGRALVATGVHFQLVFTSPKVRALDTARLACEALGAEPVVHPPLGALDVHEALALAAASGPEGRTLLVGHEPDLSQVVHDLTGARAQMKKGGLAAIALRGGTGGELLALLRPRELRNLATSQTA